MRWLLAVGAATLLLPAWASAAWISQTGPFPVGNLLSYANSDFERQANFIPTLIATISDSTAGFLHSHSLEDTVAKAGTSTFTLQKGVAIGVRGKPAPSAHTSSCPRRQMARRWCLA